MNRSSILLFAIVFVLLGVAVFFVGSHNVDVAWNLVRTEQTLENGSLVDCNLFNCEGVIGVYNSGVVLSLVGFGLLLLGIFCLLFLVLSDISFENSTGEKDDVKIENGVGYY